VSEKTLTTPAEVAAAWWASRLGNATHNAGMRGVSEMELTVMLNAGTVRGSRTAEEQERFRAALEEVIGEHLRDCPGCKWMPSGEHRVKVEYDPDDLLYAAAERAGIDMDSRELPVKTVMLFQGGEILAKEGYGSPYEVIWKP
jgi:hypothetical protein